MTAAARAALLPLRPGHSKQPADGPSPAWPRAAMTQTLKFTGDRDARPTIVGFYSTNGCVIPCNCCPVLLYPFNFELAQLYRAGIGMVVTDAQFCLRTARALSPIRPELAASFVNRVVNATVDPRRRNLAAPIPSIIRRNDFKSAFCWIDRALEYERSRRASRPLAP